MEGTKKLTAENLNILLTTPTDKVPVQLLRKIEKYLLKGITYKCLDIYKHFPQYTQIVKLLRPEYDVKVSDTCFQAFTINQTIYNIATDTYEMRDDFKYASSVWYIMQLEDRGMKLNAEDIYYYITTERWLCAQYALSKIKLSTCISLLKALSGDIFKVLDYLLAMRPKSMIVTAIIKANRLDMLMYLKPPPDVSTVDLKYAIYEEYNKLSMYILENCGYDGPEALLNSIQSLWADGVRYLVDKNVHITEEHIKTVLLSGSMYIIDIILLAIKNDYDLLSYMVQFSANNNCITLFQYIYDKAAINTKNVIEKYSLSPEMLDYCLKHGYVT